MQSHYYQSPSLLHSYWFNSRSLNLKRQHTIHTIITSNFTNSYIFRRVRGKGYDFVGYDFKFFYEFPLQVIILKLYSTKSRAWFPIHNFHTQVRYGNPFLTWSWKSCPKLSKIIPEGHIFLGYDFIWVYIFNSESV